MSLVYLHGFAGHPSEADTLFAPFGGALGIRLPGHGPWVPGSTCGMTDAIQRVHERIAAMEQSQVDLVGYSMGARVALSVAVQRPSWLRRVVLIGAHPGLEGEEKQERIALDEERASSLEALGMEAFMEQWEALPVLASQEAVAAPLREQMKKTRRAHTVAGLAANLREMGTGTMPSLWEELPRLTVPVLWVTGAQDSKFEALANRGHAATPNSIQVSILKAGHCAHLERPERFQAVLRRFLET
jgi:2-succinyl-6-hydroxy-2,4-cyclohexadiene-1-carboxylate synthase